VQFLCQKSQEDDRQQTSAVAHVTQVADADSPAQSARRWPQRIPAIPLALGSMTISTESRAVQDHLFHFSLRSRCTAMLAGRARGYTAQRPVCCGASGPYNRAAMPSSNIPKVIVYDTWGKPRR
jgi:hypothetical protein